MKILAFRNINLKLFFRKNKQLLIFVGTFLLFFCIGSLYIRANGGDVSLLLGKVFNNFKNTRSTGSFFKIIISSFLAKFIGVFTIFALGVGAIGAFTSAASVAAFGVFNGMYISYIYNTYSLSGIGFCALILLPPLIVFVYAIIVSATSSMAFSSVILKAVISSQTLPDIHNLFKIYIGKFVMAVILTLLSALFDAVMSNAFINFFNF